MTALQGSLSSTAQNCQPDSYPEYRNDNATHPFHSWIFNSGARALMHERKMQDGSKLQNELGGNHRIHGTHGKGASLLHVFTSVYSVCSVVPRSVLSRTINLGWVSTRRSKVSAFFDSTAPLLLVTVLRANQSKIVS
jgi:hypothetical protein